jgi:hypothetical protein
MQNKSTTLNTTKEKGLIKPLANPMSPQKKSKKEEP